MSREWQTQSIRYTISAPDLLEIEDLDEEKETVEEELSCLLHKFTGNPVEYGGHFGPFIYVEIDKEDDTEETKKDIEKIISKYLGKVGG